MIYKVEYCFILIIGEIIELYNKCMLHKLLQRSSVSTPEVTCTIFFRAIKTSAQSHFNQE